MLSCQVEVCEGEEFAYESDGSGVFGSFCGRPESFHLFFVVSAFFEFGDDVLFEEGGVVFLFSAGSYFERAKEVEEEGAVGVCELVVGDVSLLFKAVCEFFADGGNERFVVEGSFLDAEGGGEVGAFAEDGVDGGGVTAVKACCALVEVSIVGGDFV